MCLYYLHLMETRLAVRLLWNPSDYKKYAKHKPHTVVQAKSEWIPNWIVSGINGTRLIWLQTRLIILSARWIRMTADSTGSILKHGWCFHLIPWGCARKLNAQKAGINKVIGSKVYVRIFNHYFDSTKQYLNNKKNTSLKNRHHIFIREENLFHQ